MSRQQIVIENPILNSPFEEPDRHFRFDDDGITSDIVSIRRISSYFVPIAKPRKKGKQLLLDPEWTQDRLEENKLINDIRGRVELWRQGGYSGVTRTTLRLLEYWIDPEREKKLFFCQIEALETLIYIAEAAKKSATKKKSARKSSGTKAVPVEAIKHASDTRKNIPTEELRDFVPAEPPGTMLYPREPSLDPQLVWKGKDEQDRNPLPSCPI